MNSSRFPNSTASRSRGFALVVSLLILGGGPNIARAQSIAACVNNKTGAISLPVKPQRKGGPLACTKAEHSISLESGGSSMTVQRLTVVDSNNKTLATLGKTTDGANVLQFFDKAGNQTVSIGNNQGETFAGLATWDNNNVIPGSGVPRVVVGEANPNIGANNGFGLAIYDANSMERNAVYLTYDSTQTGATAFDPAGSSTGYGIFPNFGDEGFFTADAGGHTRVFTGTSIDGTTFNELALFDGAGNFSADLYQGLNSAKTTPGGFLNLVNPSGILSAGETNDVNGVAWVMFDTNNTLRMLGDFDGSTESIQEFDPNGSLVGHLP